MIGTGYPYDLGHPPVMVGSSRRPVVSFASLENLQTIHVRLVFLSYPVSSNIAMEHDPNRSCTFTYIHCRCRCSTTNEKIYEYFCSHPKNN